MIYVDYYYNYFKMQGGKVNEEENINGLNLNSEIHAIIICI